MDDMNTALATRPTTTTDTIPTGIIPTGINPTGINDAAGAAWVAAISRIEVQDRAFSPIHVFTDEVDAFGPPAYIDNVPLVTANPQHVLELDAAALRAALTEIAVTARAREERNWERARAAQVAAERVA